MREQDSESRDRRQLRKIVLAMPAIGDWGFSDVQVAQLEASFPGLRLVRARPDAFRRELADADAVMSWQLTPDDLAAAPNLQWVQLVGAGADGVLIPELVARNIPITNNSGVHAPNIAEHLMALMLAFARGLPTLMRAQSARRWRDDAEPARTFELQGQTLLIVGLGDIGLELAQRAGSFGLTVIGLRRHANPAPVAGIAEVHGEDALAAMLPRADHVAICLPLTDRTRNLFDAAMLARTKPGAYLYNVGRGAIVETEALIAALRSGLLAGAGLDVTDPEPLPPDSPLWEMPNVIITAHTSGATPHYWERAYRILATNIARFGRGEPLINVVDPQEGY